jgi:hypothetical protein
MATIVSFKSQRIQTSANTTVAPAYIVGARLVSTTSADVIVNLHDPGISATTGQARTTSATSRVASLVATNFGMDELGYPVRIMGGTCIVSPVVPAGTTVATLYLFVR